MSYQGNQSNLAKPLFSERRRVRHYWFTSWPDHHIPQCTAPLLRLVEEVEMYSKSLLPPSSQPITTPMPGSGPIIVHCRVRTRTSLSHRTSRAKTTKSIYNYRTYNWTAQRMGVTDVVQYLENQQRLLGQVHS
ncbi:receptor-type tyrosine-protein phosphatase S-like [Thunnus albacares]|uniref:receptor-type tyrosine-protein phosphatase S-like n=1 Tax=Thunnus albacares TaxID=8236 RepID=UPI001CF6CD6C|nr:receptor-type tyrosine-protein phosphatase S-like [Thunnus albacares]